MSSVKSALFFGLLILTFLFIRPKINYGQQAHPKTTYNIVDYGAIADGITPNTKSIQAAIDDANKAKGGKVIFPKGKFLTGSIEIKSDVNIYLEEDAVLLGSTNPNNYKAIVVEGRPVSPKNDDNSQLPLVLAHNATNISLSGKGMINGQGRALALNIDSLYHAGFLKDPNHDNKNSRPSETVRLKLFRFSECSQVKIVDLTIKNAACWGLSFELCSHLTITRIALINRAYWNNDGMDITDCHNVRITDCDVNAADDGICLNTSILKTWVM